MILRQTLVVVAIAALVWPAGRATAQEEVPTGVAIMSGRVVDATTDEGIEGVFVSIPALPRHTMTDAQGYFLLTGLPEGNHRWHFRRMGYSTWEGESITMDGDRFTVRLLPQPEVLAGITVVSNGFELRRRRVPAAVYAVDEAQIAASGAGNAHQLVMSRGRIPVIACGPEELFACMSFRGDLIRPGVFVDDQPFPGGLRGLSIYSAHEIHLLEVVRYRDGVRVYLTTRMYAEQLARLGRRPDPFLLVGGSQRIRRGAGLSSRPRGDQRDVRSTAPGTEPPSRP